MTDGNVIIMLSELFEGRQFHDTVVAEVSLHLAKNRQDVQDSLMRAEFEEAENTLDSLEGKLEIPAESEAQHSDVFSDLPDDQLPVVIMEDMLADLRIQAGYTKTKVASITGLTLGGYIGIEEDAENGIKRNRHISTTKGLNTLFAHYSKHSRKGVKEMYRKALESRGKLATVAA